MSIRKRLASFIFTMIGFLVLLGGLLQLGAPIIVGGFRESLDAMNSLSAIREINFNVNRQKSSLNRFLLLADQQDLLSFEESGRQAQKSFDALEAKLGKPPKWFKNIKESFDQTETSAKTIVGHYTSGQKLQAHDAWASQLFPQLQQLSSEMNELEEKKSKQAEKMFVQVKQISRNVGIVVLSVFAIAILAGLILFRSLHQAVMAPLEVLRIGATKFGKGHFEHRIDPPKVKEFGALANAFNKMADNVSQLQQQAVHMDRMSAVGQLAGGVAHEINNPLTAVLGQAQIMLAKTKEDDPRYAQLKKIENAAIRCRKIVRGLLDFSRPTQTRFEPIDVNAMIGATLDLCEADLKKGRVAVDRRLGTSLPRIRGNMSELQQVLLNLINNAIQAMPRGGNLVIETKTHNKALMLPSQTKKGETDHVNGPWVEIRVKDSGIGIAKEHIARVFDPFFTTKDIGKGTGLGLSVSTGIVQKHGGQLAVESQGLNKGSTFVMNLSLKGPTGKVSSKPNPGMAA